MEGLGGDWDRCEETANELHRMGHFSRVGVGRGFDSSYDTHFTLNVIPSNTSIISSPLSPATSANIQSILQKYIPAGLGNNDEPVHVKMRKEALKADEAYKEGVRRAEERRLEMEERIERGLRSWEGWERERLGVIKAGTLVLSEGADRPSSPELRGSHLEAPCTTRRAYQTHSALHRDLQSRSRCKSSHRRELYRSVPAARPYL